MQNRLQHLWPAEAGERPTWATCFDRRQEQLLERRVREYFIDQPEAVVQDGWVHADGHKYGLDNLALLCLALPEDEWPQCVAGHFDGLRNSHSEAREWVARKGDLAWVRPRLCVRLYHKGALPRHLTVVREDLPGIDTVLVGDLPSLACNVSPEDVASWGCGQEEPFAIAMHNLEQAQHGTWHTCAIDVPGRVRVHALEGGSLFAASHVLQLDRWPERLGRHGTLVAVPNRHIITLYAIDSAAVRGATPHFLQMVHHMHRNGPGQISKELYWRRPDGSFLHLPARFRGNDVRLQPPDEYVRMLHGLR